MAVSVPPFSVTGPSVLSHVDLTTRVGTTVHMPGYESRTSSVSGQFSAFPASSFASWTTIYYNGDDPALLVVAGSLASRTILPEWLQDWLPITAMFAAFAVSSVIGQWYGRAYGRVRALPGMHARRSRIKWFVIYPLVLATLIIDVHFKLTVATSALAFAVAVEAYRRSTGGGRRHYVIASAVFIASGVAPALGLVAPGADTADMVIALLGATYVVGGVLDHLELRRALPAIPRTDGPVADAWCGQ